MKCKIEGCELEVTKYKIKGLCVKHYKSKYYLENKQDNKSKEIISEISRTRQNKLWSKPEYKRMMSLAHRKYELDENIFEEIDSIQKAYWLGFIFAEGGLIELKNSLRLLLHPKEENHLSYFVSFLKSNYLIKHQSIYPFVNIQSDKLIGDLINLGVHQNKSRTIVFPDIRDCFKKSFILGFFDGDGSIFKFKGGKRNRRLYLGASITSSSKLFLEGIQKFIPLELTSNIYNKKKENSYFLSWSCRKARKFLEWLYFEEPFFIGGKKDIFVNYIKDYKLRKYERR